MNINHAPAEKKIVAAVIFSVAASVLSNLGSALLALILALLLVSLCRLPWRSWLKAMLPLSAFCLLLWLMLPLSPADETPLFSMGPLDWHAQGLKLALLITLKACAITSSLLALIGSSSVSENGRALLRLHVPGKLVTLLLVTHTSNMLLYKEYRRIRDAAKLRGFQPRNRLATYKTLGWMAAMLLLRAWRKARRREDAMKLRGFQGLFPLLDAAPEKAATPARRTAGALWALCLLSSGLLFLDMGMKFWS